MDTYLYLHGFASSPNSTKAKTLRDRFQARGLTLHCLDLNQENFSTLTLTRQIQQAQDFLATQPAPVTVIGSSFGGLTAAWLGELNPSIQRLILLAPAFSFLDYWLPKLGAETLRQWEENGTLLVYHYGEQRQMPLHYGFLTDLQRYPEDHLQRPVPTTILHGLHDEVIPLAASQRYAQTRPWVHLHSLNSDHALTDCQAVIWKRIQQDCQLG
jgi:pimeloyl-ACP methyl ester carboxylesterase